MSNSSSVNLNFSNALNFSLLESISSLQQNFSASCNWRHRLNAAEIFRFLQLNFNTGNSWRYPVNTNQNIYLPVDGIMPPKSLTTSHVPRKLIRAWFNELVCSKCTVPKSETTILRNSFISGNTKIGSCLQCALLQLLLFLYVFSINKNTFSLKAESVQFVVQNSQVSVFM